MRHFETRLIYLRELEDRRQTILKSIEEQGKLTDELRSQIQQVQSKTELEDLYLPINQNAAPKDKLPLKQVWNRWRIYFGHSLKMTQKPPHFPLLMPKRRGGQQSRIRRGKIHFNGAFRRRCSLTR